MSLNITIPALDARPLITAETHPRKIAEFIDRLPMAEPLDASAILLEEMETMNRQKVAPDTRLNALETYRKTIVQLAELLAAHYCNITLPLPEDAKKHAGTAESLWRELAYGYKLALIDQETKLFSIGGDDLAALAIQRAIDALAQLSMVYYQTYFTTLGTVWSDMHQLYFHAAKEKLETLPIKNHEGAPTTINLTYKQALLMSLADPQHLAPDDIKLVATYISRYGRLALLHDLATFENPAGIFLISLDSDKPPIPYVKNTRKADASRDILLVTIELARQVHQDIQTLQSGEMPKKGGVPGHVTKSQYLNLLLHLFSHWGVAPSRAFTRSRKVDAVQVGVGLTAASYLIGGEDDAAHKGISQNGQSRAQTATAQNPEPASPGPTRWQVLNISAGGMALRNASNSRVDIQVGKLICLKNRQDARWSIGIVRRAVHSTHHQIEIGVQLVSPSAIPVGIREHHETEFKPALLLPEIPSLKQPASIIADCGIHAHAKQVELETGNTISGIVLTRLVDRTDHLERFNFSYASK